MKFSLKREIAGRLGGKKGDSIKFPSVNYATLSRREFEQLSRSVRRRVDNTPVENYRNAVPARLARESEIEKLIPCYVHAIRRNSISRDRTFLLAPRGIHSARVRVHAFYHLESFERATASERARRFSSE